MIGPLLRNYMRIKVVGFLLNLFLGKRGAVLKSTTRVTLLSFILEEIFSQIFNRHSKQRSNQSTKTHPNEKRLSK